MISLTSNAATEIRRIMKESSLSDNVPIRLGIKGGGCAGFTYYFDFEQKEPDKFDRNFESQEINIIVDRKSLLYIDGTEIDFNTSLMERGFKFNNPKANAACGCGTSFTPKQTTFI